MSATTAILVTMGGLLLYYVGMIAYDLYLSKLAEASKDEDNEQAIDISGQASEFKSMPVSKQQTDESVYDRFVGFMATGIPAQLAKQMIDSSAEGDNIAAELEDVMCKISQFAMQEEYNQNQ